MTFTESELKTIADFSALFCKKDQPIEDASDLFTAFWEATVKNCTGKGSEAGLMDTVDIRQLSLSSCIIGQFSAWSVKQTVKYLAVAEKQYQESL